jgi:hypothetical protein
MRKINKKIEKIWSHLLENKSIGYLIRAKIEQNISLVISNISSSFMGNRQLANHNTDDIRYNLNKILESNPPSNVLSEENIELLLLEHRQKLNTRLLKNSEDLLKAVINLQTVHKKIMKTNDEVISFNSKMIAISIEALTDQPTVNIPQIDEIELNERLDRLEKNCSSTEKKYDSLMKDVELTFQNNLNAQEEINSKRHNILINRRAISQCRSDIDTFL